MNSPFKFASLLLEKYCLEKVISPIFYKESQGEEYNCQEDGVLYYNRKYPRGYKDKDKYTKTWQECQERCRNKISLNSIFEIKKVLGLQGLRGLHLAQRQSLEPEMVKSLFTFLNI